MSRKSSRRKFLRSATLSLGAAAALGKSGLALRMRAKSDAETKLDPAWRHRPVLNLSRSPHAKLRQIPVGEVTITGFWAQRRRTNVQSSLPTMRDELLQHGRLDNFLRLAGGSTQPQRGPVYSDSDCYKWTEAVGFVLQSGANADLRASAERMISAIAAAQESNGYLNTYFVGAHRSERMQQHTQEVGHELYCIGHLLQAAIAYYGATGDPALLNVGIRFVDNFLLPNYGPGANQTPIVAGHPEIEMALVELYRTTGNRRYLDLAGYILQGDLRWKFTPGQLTYMFCGKPFTSRTKLEGHAVRAMYACCGATDYFLETGDPMYWQTLERLWEDLSERQMYVTGGVGARSEGEAFGDDYELPNARAYGESCAAIGNFMWNARMLAATGDARFTDVMERALYNGINSGMSLNGRLYCYRNPLAFEPRTGDVIRNAWYDTTCCPPNLERTFASLPGYFYSTSKDGLYVHFYDASTMNSTLDDGTRVTITQDTRYPWDGGIKLTVSPVVETEFTLFVRVPGWSRRTGVEVNGAAMAQTAPGTYLPIRRRWKAGDVVELTMDMSPRVLEANPAVSEDVGKIVLQRGPIVFCMEGLDQQPGSSVLNLGAYAANPTGVSEVHYDPNLLDGVTVLEHPGTLSSKVGKAPLYNSIEQNEAAPENTVLRLIPYYAWANREPSAMQVWIPRFAG